MTGSDPGPAGGGSVPLEGMALRMVRTGTQLTVGERLPGRAVLRNVGKKAWTMKPAGEPPKRVDPARRLAVRG